MEVIARPHAKNLVRWAKDRPEVLVLSADLTSSCEANDFRDAYPERFFSLGLAEQNMMGFAAGLAREGFIPLVHTFAVFICRRAFDQVAMSIGYSNLKVRLLGFLPGITTPGGATHQAIDDVGLMRLIPNMNILECADATEVESVLDVAQALEGPVYMRMLRGDVPRLFPQDEPMRFNRARVISEGYDLTLLSSGICTEEALRVTCALRQRDIHINHLHISTLKPFSDPNVLNALKAARKGVVTLENHNVIGGLGSAVAELMAEAGIRGPLVRLGIKDQYAHGASRPYLMRKFGLDAAALLEAVSGLLGRGVRIRTEDLPQDLPGVSSKASIKAEDL
ncbi:MAG: transketolase [Deltaproteobacteria bacterium]|nr:transketolase [Deltaproteobacteria bacterium]